MTTETKLQHDEISTDDRLPIYCQFPGQFQPQPAHIIFELSESGESRIYADYSGEIGNVCSFDVYHGHTRRYSIPATTSADGINAILQDESVITLCKKLIGLYHSEWDGSNWIAQFGDEREQAESFADQIDAPSAQIEQQIEVAISDIGMDYQIDVYSASDLADSQADEVTEWLAGGYKTEPLNKISARLFENDDDEYYIDGTSDDISEYIIEQAEQLDDDDITAELTAALETD